MIYKKAVGRFGEKIARNFLIKHGYVIVEVNIKTSYPEIDIIARRDGVLVFVEVKTRTSDKFGSADQAITRVKSNNFKKAINLYLVRHNVNYKNIRADLIAVDIDKIRKTAKIKHYQDII